MNITVPIAVPVRIRTDKLKTLQADFESIPFHPIITLPLLEFQCPFDQDLAALYEIFVDNFSLSVLSLYFDEVDVFTLFASLAVSVAFVHCHSEIGDRCVAVGEEA